MMLIQDIKYHTQDMTHIFCGAECSLSYHQRYKDNEKTNNNIKDFNNNNSNQSRTTTD
jgi:hypothetical protein